jgi:hypothetical protein
MSSLTSNLKHRKNFKEKETPTTTLELKPVDMTVLCYKVRLFFATEKEGK